MRVYFIRHAQSSNNALLYEEANTARSHDPTLTETGVRQAERLGAYLATQPEMPTGTFGQERNPDDMSYCFTHLYCSAMHRAMHTATIIGRALNMRPVVWREMHEVGGIYLDETETLSRGLPGLTRAEMLLHFPDVDVEDDAVSETGWWPVEKGRESWDEAKLRAKQMAAALTARAATNPRDRVAIVTHGAFMSLVMQWLLHSNMSVALYYAHYNTGISRLDFNTEWDSTRLHYLNRLEHLAPEERTY